MKWERTFNYTKYGIRTGSAAYSLYLFRPPRLKKVAAFSKWGEEKEWHVLLAEDVILDDIDEMLSRNRLHPKFKTVKAAKGYVESFFREDIELGKAVDEVRPKLSPSNQKRL